MSITKLIQDAWAVRSPTNTPWTISLLSKGDEEAFIAYVKFLRDDDVGMDDDYIARQAVDDHYRATKVSFHDVQGAVAVAVSRVPR